VVTTGGSVSEVIALARQAGGKLAGVAFIVDRSGGKVRFAMDAGGVQCSLMAMDVVAYPPADCPLCARGLPVIKPGSRGNK
jgi:orotate phosphoribosyltransferase